MTTVETKVFDAAEHLHTDEERREFLSAALETGDADYVAHALGVIARAHGMTDIAAATGKQRQALYRSLAQGGNPTLDTFFRTLGALGIKLAAV